MPTGRPFAPAKLLGLVVLAALAARLAGFGQSLYGDELYTYGDVVGRGLGDVFREVEHVEDNPPGYFVLAWLAAKLGEPALTIRLPSLLFGVATVPALYWVGVKAIGERAALLGAALFAISPFAVFYADEARPYALMTFFVVLAAGLLLAAVRANRRLPWIAFAACVALALYSHYTAVFALAAMGIWAFWTSPAARRPLVLAYAAAILAFVPWLAISPGTGSFKGFAVLFPFTARNSAEGLARALVGAPFRGLRDVPGTAAWLLLAAAVLIAATQLLRPSRLRRPSPELGLVIGLALATPAGVALYSGAVSSIFAPRNLIAMLPFTCLLAGAVIAALDRPRMLAATGCAVVGLALGTFATLGDASRRPPWRDAAKAIDGSFRTGDVIGQYQPFPVSTPGSTRQPLLDSLRAYLDHPERAVQVDAGNPEDLDRLARGGRRLRLVVGQITGLEGVPPAPRLDGRFRLLPGRRTWDAFAPVALYDYAIIEP